MIPVYGAIIIKTFAAIFLMVYLGFQWWKRSRRWLWANIVHSRVVRIFITILIVIAIGAIGYFWLQPDLVTLSLWR